MFLISAAHVRLLKIISNKLICQAQNFNMTLGFTRSNPEQYEMPASVAVARDMQGKQSPSYF
jgi:hypothetical protein